MIKNNMDKLRGEELFEFRNFQHWVAKAQSLFSQHDVSSANSVCIDSAGNICRRGADFMRACDNDNFPVKVFRTT